MRKIEGALHCHERLCHRAVKLRCKGLERKGVLRAFNGVGFGELCAVFDQGRRECVPRLIRGEAEVDVRAGEIVGVKLDVTTSLIDSSIMCLSSAFCLFRKARLDVCWRRRRSRGGKGKRLREQNEGEETYPGQMCQRMP